MQTGGQQDKCIPIAENGMKVDNELLFVEGKSTSLDIRP
jgi:hypothetical protein